MPRPLRLASWNVEWFTHLFDDQDRLRPDRDWSGRHQVTRLDQIAALATVLRAMDPDAVMVIEAPDTGSRRSSVRALEAFARETGLRVHRAVTGFASETEQEISLLYAPDRLRARHDPREAPDAPRFDGLLRFDVDGDALPEPIRFSKPPLELAVTVRGRPLRLIGVHLKSKSPHGARSPEEAIRIGIDNRRKQLAEAVWLRRRIEAHLTAGDSLIVLGDVNDGPGLDEYEKLFGHSALEVLMGVDAPPQARLFDPHARLARASRHGLTASTARFWNPEAGRYFEALLDYILVSPDLAQPPAGPRTPVWRIWHPLNDPACAADPDLARALLTASDHFPVTLDLWL